MWRGRVTARKLLVRIRGLLRSRESALRRSYDPDGTRWSATDHLIAQLIDTVHAAHGSDYTVPRPGSAEEKAALEQQRQRAQTRERSMARFYEEQQERLERRAG